MKKVNVFKVVVSVFLVLVLTQSATVSPVLNEITTEVNEIPQNQILQVVALDSRAKQIKLLDMAYTAGKENGLQNPEIVQAILLQETHAGVGHYKVANPGPNAYFGPMQITLVAARAVLSRWPSLYERFDFHTRTDDEVKANLILNEQFNLDIAAKYLVMLKHDYGFTGRGLLNAYNRGPAGSKDVGPDYHYAIGAEAKLAAWKQLH
jgi:hypothetical protein